MKWIRPGGAIVFVFLAAVIGLSWWLLADWLLKTAIEKVGTKAVGARVELAAAKLSFSPLGFHLARLQITDPQQPMQNLMEVDSATGNLELLPLLMGQVIIDELSASGVRFQTERTTSGAISKPKVKEKPPAEKQKTGFDIGAMKEKLPSVDEIMAREPLSTVEQTKDFQQNITSQRRDLEQNIAALPQENKIKQYDQRINDLTSGKITSVEDFKRRETELEKLKDQIRADRDSVVKVRDQARGAKQQLNNQYQALKNAPGDDWARLKDRYGLDSAGAENITRLLFGDTAQTWLQRLRSWIIQVRRLLPSGSSSDNDVTPEPVKPARGEGHFIRYTSANPVPDFLLRRALLGLELKAGNIELEVTDATHQPQVLGRPMRIHASGSKLKNADNIQINGVLDHVDPKAAKDTLQWSVSGWQLAEVSLSKSATLPLSLTKAHADLTGKAELAEQTLTANLDAAFKNTQWRSDTQNGIAGRLINSLSAVKQFKLDGKLQGKFDAPRLTLRSDLDEQLKQAIAGQLKSEQAELEQKLKKRLNAEIEKAAGPHKDQLAFLTDTESTLDQRRNRLDEMLKAKLKSAADTQKQQATDKLKGKLKGLKF